jgi:hypothetical protein
LFTGGTLFHSKIDQLSQRIFNIADEEEIFLNFSLMKEKDEAPPPSL